MPSHRRLPGSGSAGCASIHGRQDRGAEHDRLGAGAETRLPNVSNRWAAIGGSQGGAAVWAADEQAATYAPEMELVGAVALAPAADVTGLVDKAQAATLTHEQVPALQLIIESLARLHPDINRDDYRRGVAAAQWDALSACSGRRCTTARRRSTRLARVTSRRTPEAADRLRKYLAQWAAAAAAPLGAAVGGIRRKGRYIDTEWTTAAISRACRLGGTVVWDLSNRARAMAIWTLQRDSIGSKIGSRGSPSQVNASRNPDGDDPLWRQLMVEAKCVVKRRLAPRGTAVARPDAPYLVVPVLGQSNAQGMGVGLDVNGADRPRPLVHQWAMCGPSSGTAILAVDPLLHDVPSKGVGFGVTFGRRLAEATGRAVLLIPGARGDTSFAPKNGHTWDPADLGTPSTCTAGPSRPSMPYCANTRKHRRHDSVAPR